MAAIVATSLSTFLFPWRDLSLCSADGTSIIAASCMVNEGRDVEALLD